MPACAIVHCCTAMSLSPLRLIYARAFERETVRPQCSVPPASGQPIPTSCNTNTPHVEQQTRNGDVAIFCVHHILSILTTTFE
ncbi:hypothetical protein EJ02DRAFT_455020 [Clathrospora elynae]|uniref:Uncharacterized protein n=1 Tax=Clathrospora elynae TaxID=706981 RepID=A0A6A5SPG7_9PLEO|nr:hypothetical protein EJ02DRAFT_455020 [Clathrospora elynae]